MGLLDLRKRLEPLRDILVSLVAHRLRHPRVHLRILVSLSCDRCGQVLVGIPNRLVRRGIAYALQIVEVAMGMAGLRLRGITKQPTDVRIASNVGLPCEIEIPPIGLGLSGKGVLEISMCLASLQVTHFFSCSWIDFPLADHRLIIG